uniref:Uncharacterized protein n=1 Tax=Arundo donax TaxID=35708 RepID=A0A0A9HI62_ARUDO
MPSSTSGLSVRYLMIRDIQVGTNNLHGSTASSPTLANKKLPSLDKNLIWLAIELKVV